MDLIMGVSNIIRAAIVTTTDSRSRADDVSGARLRDLLELAGAEVFEHLVIDDDLDGIRQTLHMLTERQEINLILTTGGTGFGPRDNTPEATLAVIEREALGISEAMRRETASKTPMAMLSRGVAGIRNGTLIVNLPGSPKGVEECFDVIRPILQHAVNLVSGNTKH